jgi:FtsP/CotA-like multicopper oxidase with cupredoxin domain
VLVLRRDEPTDIKVINRLSEGTTIHWHGLELESYSDGVAGWSGTASRLAPVIAPSDSFTAHLTLHRPGTFIYHTHLNDLEQQTSGLYGAIVVLEPGRHFDSTRDHVLVVGWDGNGKGARMVVNGDSTAAPLIVAAGVPQRFRFINIGPANRAVFSIKRDSSVVTWRRVAKDGAELPPILATMGPASGRLGVGETFDAEFLPAAGEKYHVTVATVRGRIFYDQQILVR